MLRRRWIQRATGFFAAEYLRLVWLTNKFSFDPPDLYEKILPSQPFIVAFWHGQHLMTPFIKNKEMNHVKALISLHHDGEFNAITVERLGIGTIRGSGDHGSEFHRKRGVGAFKKMMRTFANGDNVASTADVPKVWRIAGLGLITLARASGRPIVPVAIVTSRFLRMRNWDRTTINLPFGRGVIAGGEVIWVPRDADEETMERLRAEVEAALNRASRRGHLLVGAVDEGRDG